MVSRCVMTPTKPRDSQLLGRPVDWEGYRWVHVHTPYSIPHSKTTQNQGPVLFCRASLSLSGQLPKLEGHPLKVPHGFNNELLFLRDAHCYRIIPNHNIYYYCLLICTCTLLCASVTRRVLLWVFTWLSLLLDILIQHDDIIIIILLLLWAWPWHHNNCVMW